jgi:outer membrane protein TolC
MRRIVLLSLALAVALPGTYAQELTPGAAPGAALDVEACVKLAVTNNLSLKADRITLGKAGRARDTVWSSWLPSVDASVGVTRSNAEPLLPGVSPWNMAVTLEASLPLSLATVESARATILGYESGQLDFEAAQKQLERDVRKAFYSLLLSQESIRLAEQQLATAEKSYDNAMKRVQAGLAPKLDALTARVTADNLKPALEDQRVALRGAEMSFQLLLGLEPTERLAVTGAMEAPVRHFDAGRLAAAFVDRRLDVQSLERQIQIMESRRKIQERTAYTPSLSASLSWAPGINDPFAFNWAAADQWTDAGSLSLGLKIPLDSFVPGSSGSVAVASARDDVDSTQLSLRQARQKAVVEITSLVLSLEKSLSAMGILDLNIARAQEAYDLTATSYASGATELIQVQSAADELQKARFLVVKERFSYLSGLIDLSYALNLPLTELMEGAAR